MIKDCNCTSENATDCDEDTFADNETSSECDEGTNSGT